MLTLDSASRYRFVVHLDTLGSLVVDQRSLLYMSSPTPQGAIAGARVLVTGAAGFVGAHLVERLRDLGAVIHGVSRHPQSGATGTTWHMMDLTDSSACQDLVDAIAPDVVFHLASVVSGSRDVGYVVPTMAANLS